MSKKGGPQKDPPLTPERRAVAQELLGWSRTLEQHRSWLPPRLEQKLAGGKPVNRRRRVPRGDWR